MTLANLNINEKKHIKRLLGDDTVKSRLMTLGFFTGNTISIQMKSLGNAVVLVGGTRVGIALDLLEKVEIEDE
jgi:Fe2+ transport system protein FeoA